MATTLIRADKVLSLDRTDSIYSPGYLLVEDNLITRIGAGKGPDDRPFDEIINLGRRLVMPGLVNAHTHSPMTLFRGRVEGNTLFTLEGWYNTIRVVEEVMSPEMIPPGVRVSCAEMIRTGTTTFADQYFWMDRIMPEVQASGLRAALAYGVVELGDEAARERELAAVRAFLESLKDDPLLAGWVGPHAFFVDNSEEAMRIEMDLAKEFNTGLHFHLGTNGAEDHFTQEHYGISAIAKMEEMGLLEHRLLAAHSITLPVQDMPTLAGKDFTAVLAPSSAMRNAAGVAPLREMLDAGMNLALGTDNVTNNNSYDMFKEMQIAGKLMALHYREPNAIDTRTILEMATLGGARALGLEHEIGSLETGKKADLISLDLDEIGWAPAAQDEITAIVYSLTGQHVRDVMVDGRWLFRDNQWKTVDYQSAVQELEEANSDLNRLLSN